MLVFLQGVLARIIASAAWKGAVKLYWRLRYLGSNVLGKILTKQDSNRIKDAKTKEELDKAAESRIGHI